MPPYFQPVIDLIASHPPPNGRLDLVLELCREVEAEHGPGIVLATDRVVRNVSPLSSPPMLIPEAVWYETMARMLLMGEHADLQRLLEWYERTVAGTRTRKEMISLHWQGLFELITLPQAGLGEKELDRQLLRVVTALKFVIASFASAVREEGKPMIPHPSLGEPPPGSFGTATFGRPARSVVLADGIRKLVRAWMILHQQFLDEAWRQLGSGAANRGEKLLALRARWRRALGETFAHPSFGKLARLAEIDVPLSEIRYGRSPNHAYLDAFPPHDSRTFRFTPYDREPEDEPPAKTIWLSDLFQYRGRQLHFLLDAYGEHYPPDTPPRGPAAWLAEVRRRLIYAGRRKLMDLVEKKGAPLRLETEDDLAAFGCALLQVLTGGAAAQPGPSDRLDAWNTLLDFLVGHLRTQTTHTEFNLAERPSYFQRLFPRAINGGALMDCGVYAVLFAFVFLSWAECLKSAAYPKPPRVSFVMLPLHVGLIVELDGLPPVVLHNEVLFRLTGDQVRIAREEWDKSPEPGDPKDPDLLDRKFLEDVAAQMFLRDVDTPILRLPVAPVSAPPRKAEIWKAFQTLVVKNIDRLFAPVVESPGRPEFQFDIRFLSALGVERNWHDEVVVPFWNRDCYGLWQRYSRSRKQDADRKKYLDDLDALIVAVDESYKADVLPVKQELTADLRANPKLLGRKAQRITVSSRLAGFASALGPVGVARQHLDKARNTPGAIPDPPFATEADFISRSGG